MFLLIIVLVLLSVIFVFAAPSLTTVTLNSTIGSNTTSEDLIITTDQDDNSSVKLIHNWHLNGNPITVLNLPFENNTPDTSSTTKDYSDYENNATVTNAIWSSTGGFDGKGAFNFSGNSLIEIPFNESLQPKDEITMMAWVKFDSASGYASVIQYPYDCGGHSDPYFEYGIYVQDNGRLHARINGAGYDHEGTGVTDGDWHHVAVTWDGVTKGVNYYVDGSNVGTVGGSQTEMIYENDCDVLIGQNGGANEQVDGMIDEVMIFNVSLSDEQIEALYENRTGRIVSQETTVGDVWNTSVTPNDGIQDGIAMWSNPLTVIANSPPTHTTPVLSSSLGTNTYLENLTVVNQSTSDVNNDPVRNIFNWYLNGTSIAVLNMPFEFDGTNNARDYSSYENNGTTTGTTWSSSNGYDGNGAHYFGYQEDDLIAIPYDESLDLQDYTISTWLNIDELHYGVHWVINRPYNCTSHENSYMEYGFSYVNGSGLLYRIDGSEVYTNLALNKDTWYHVVQVHNSSNILFYIDGELNYTGPGDSSINYENDCGIRIGTNPSDQEDFNGYIDDVMIFDRILTPEQIAALYDNRTDLIVSQETGIGDDWKATITPNDGVQDGTTLWSNALTILEEAAGPVPEFSDYAIALLLLTVIGGFFVMRKK